ncbi:hypothetical protein CR105_26435 [Massilia eurypsychrophila]|uniref:Head-tail adaptor protein n=1 Tax=Massilia eurypsychrophila TaxID=1485217 RepID=A0A2G8T7J7_9BURK|nr:head-tail adaptor protein [Massilia eurypsychrophila]PIL42036.1 hypothetical protein CR105_26435 [Massilia eurypsychrophila]
MVATFRCDEQVTIERKTVSKDPVHGSAVETWAVVADHYWANVQDVLPSRGETTENGLRAAVQRTRLRMRKGVFLPADRVTLHSHGNRGMQIIAGPALLDDRDHVEFMLESFTNG